jgi:putative ATPase
VPAGDSLELFGDVAAPLAAAPLAARMRPRSLDEVVGQTHLLAPGAPLRVLAVSKRLPSIVLWGPPGCGKTTLAGLLAGAGPPPAPRFLPFSAVTVGVKEIREVAERARHEAAAGRRTVLFLDEIHRFNRGQQDALLPHVETGTLTLIGATTENPSFEVNGALLSRCRVFTLRALSEEDLRTLLLRALTDAERGLGRTGIRLEPDALESLVAGADGDARRALGMLEAAVTLHGGAAATAIHGRAAATALTAETVRQAAGSRVLLHDRDREEHHNVVSALIKSLRASDPDAALYYLARLLEAGDDPLFVARRLVIFAAEDVGNAEPSGLGLATSAYLALERIGLPEGRIPLAQAVTFLACAPKSNASYVGITRAAAAVTEHGALPVPLHLRNAPTALLRELGYGRDYRSPHDAPERFVADANLPERLRGARFYEPTREGDEAALADRLDRWRRQRDAEPGGSSD